MPSNRALGRCRMGACLSHNAAVADSNKAAGGVDSNGLAVDTKPRSGSVQAKRGREKSGKTQLPEIHTAPPVAEVDIWEAPTIAGKSTMQSHTEVKQETSGWRTRVQHDHQHASST